jgi:hypothetical protein
MLPLAGEVNFNEQAAKVVVDTPQPTKKITKAINSCNLSLDKFINFSKLKKCGCEIIDI